jgi:hypothetical protein
MWNIPSKHIPTMRIMEKCQALRHTFPAQKLGKERGHTTSYTSTSPIFTCPSTHMQAIMILRGMTCPQTH